MVLKHDLRFFDTLPVKNLIPLPSNTGWLLIKRMWWKWHSMTPEAGHKRWWPSFSSWDICSQNPAAQLGGSPGCPGSMWKCSGQRLQWSSQPTAMCLSEEVSRRPQPQLPSDSDLMRDPEWEPPSRPQSTYGNENDSPFPPFSLLKIVAILCY